MIEEIRWASIAFAASFESSEDHRPTVRIRSWLKIGNLISAALVSVEQDTYKVGVDFLEALAYVETLRCLQGSNQYAIGAEKIRNGRSLHEEFGVGEDVEVAVGLRVGLENGAH